MNQLKVILRQLGLRVDAQVLERLKRERLSRRERLLKQDGAKICHAERPIEKSLATILSHIQPGDGCWIWNGPRDADGYGITYITGKCWRASGDIPTDQCVLHRCDNPPCVRPDHLFVGSHSVNALDAFAKGRRVAPRPNCLFTEEQVIQIRKRYQFRDPKNNCTAIASDLGVKKHAVWEVVSRRSYNHIV